jgi:hypothetical protein
MDKQVPLLWICVLVGYWLAYIWSEKQMLLFVWSSIPHNMCMSNRHGNCEQIINLSAIRREVKDAETLFFRKDADTLTACLKLKNVHAKAVEGLVYVYI